MFNGTCNVIHSWFTKVLLAIELLESSDDKVLEMRDLLKDPHMMVCFKCQHSILHRRMYSGDSEQYQEYSIQWLGIKLNIL